MRTLGIPALAAAVLCSSQALAINTFHQWDGSNYEFPFGCEDSQVYGQTITIPKFRSSVGGFTFWLANYQGKGPIVVRGEIYQWDPVNIRATGSAVWESAPRRLNFKDTNFHHVTFNADATVTPGAQYVLFLTTDKDQDTCKSRGLKWGILNSNGYAGGGGFYLNDNGDTSEWTTTSWSNVGLDFAFKATMPVLP